MVIQFGGIFSADQIAHIQASLQAEADTFTSGKATAGWYAKSVKHNDQSVGPAAQKAMELTREALLKHAAFGAAARPKEFVKLLVSRYRPGAGYGTHVDDALMGGKRTDLSFTLFLSDPASYEGGELVIEGNDGDTSVKLEPGSLVLYPTTSLHRVEEVTQGERLAIVGWIRSYIRSPEHRELLFDLDQAVAAMRELQLDRRVVDRVLKVRSNLTRMWAED